jgi:hypothetical protein
MAQGVAYSKAMREPPKEYENTNREWTKADIQEKHRDLMASTESLDFFALRRGISSTTLQKYDVGLHSPGLFMIPIYDHNKRLMNVRFYSPSAKRKWCVKGKSTKLIFPWHLLNGDPTLWMLEGELDSMVAFQHGIPHVTTCSGAPSAPQTFAKFRGLLGSQRRYILCFDNDEAGQEAAARTGLDVFPGQVDGIIRWPVECKDGYDLSDWFQDKHTLDDLRSGCLQKWDEDWAKDLLKRKSRKSRRPKMPDDEFDLNSMWPSSGFLKEYVDYAQTLTDSPDQFHCATALTIMGTVTQRKVFYWMGSDKIYPNFYACLVAPSSIYRKSTAIKIGIRMLCKMNRQLLLPREFSTESMVNHLSTHPHGLFAFSEIAELLDQFKRSYSEGMLALLTDFYDCPDLYERKTLQKGMQSIRHPFISILGASTVDWLNNYMQVNQAEGGFWPRFLFFSARQRKPLMEVPPQPDQGIYEKLCVRLQEGTTVDGQFSMTNGAQKVLRDWIRQKHSDADSGVLPPMFLKYAARLQPYAIKISMLFEMSESNTTLISTVSMIRALSLCTWLLTNLKYLFSYEIAYGYRDAQDMRILEYVRSCPDGVSFCDLSRRFRLRNNQLRESVDTLIMREYVEVARSDDGRQVVVPAVVQGNGGNMEME